VVRVASRHASATPSLGRLSPPRMSSSTAPTTSLPATRSIAPVSARESRLSPAPRSVSTVKSLSSMHAIQAIPAITAFSAKAMTSRRLAARPWACSHRWSASSARPRRRRC
jgi:hypothetical protein